MKFRALVIICVLVTVGCAACGSSTTAAPRPTPVVPLPAVGAAETFVAVRYLPGHSGTQALTVSSAVSGKILRQLLPDPWHGMWIYATAVDASGRVWVTLSKGPACTSDVAGCGPRPGSCASEVIRLQPGRSSPVVAIRGTPNQLIADGQPSPDGSRLAYLLSGCTRSYFDSHIAIESLATKAVITVGASLPVCHSLGSLAWTSSGTALTAFYGPSLVAAGQGARYGYGTCPIWGPQRLVVLPAQQAAGLPGGQPSADPGCQIEAAAPTRTGYAAIEACGGRDYLSGPARLLQLDSHLHVTARTLIGSCVNGAELASTRGGRHLLANTYQYCNSTVKLPQDIVFVATSAGPKIIIDDKKTGSPPSLPSVGNPPGRPPPANGQPGARRFDLKAESPAASRSTVRKAASGQPRLSRKPIGDRARRATRRRG